MMQEAATVMGSLIAVESERQGLQEIYTENNVRVRAVDARIAELKRQLQQLGGKTDGDNASVPITQASMYPTIRQLPMLGLTYADLYRRTKIQEIVYETLTQQYELAKVEEAKETPSVRILDVAKVAESALFHPGH